MYGFLTEKMQNISDGNLEIECLYLLAYSKEKVFYVH